MNKRVLLLYVGGVDCTEEVLHSYLELQLLSDVTIKTLSHTAGADITWESIQQLGQIITQHYKDYDGFVVIHGIDNAIYSSTFLRFMFKQIGKPIIFTGGPSKDDKTSFAETLLQGEPGAYGEIGIRTNLVTSVQLATLDCSGVFLAYGSRIVRAVRALEQSDGETHWFKSFHEEDVATIQFDIHLHPATPHRNALPLQFDPRYNPHILTLPGLPSIDLPDLSTTAAIIMPGYQEQLLPSVVPFPKTIPIIVYTKTTPVDKLVSALPDNVVVVSRATYQSTYTKIMATLGQTTSLAEFLEAFKVNVHGEFY